MFSALSPGAVSVSAPNLEAAIEAAKVGGFQGVEVSPSEVADRVERDGGGAVLSLFESAEVKAAGWGMPVAWRAGEEEFRESLAGLTRMAKACAVIGALRTFTWIMPISAELEFTANRKFHIDRLGQVASVLHRSDCRFGLEFIGPKTIRDRGKHLFIYKMEEMLEMAKAIGPNVGLLLDCWHWYTSGGTLDDLKALSAEDVVYVHVNDAPSGVHRDEQIDNRRCLPGETGVIDIAGFLGALKSIGYDGPVVPEPFKSELSDLPTDEERIKAVGSSMRAIGL